MVTVRESLIMYAEAMPQAFTQEPNWSRPLTVIVTAVGIAV